MSFLMVVSVYAIITSVLFDVMYKAQPLPFIDEIFHIPQVQKYCHGFFNEWDPKITTLPGMYYLSVLLLSPGIAVNGAQVCSTWALRYLNVLFNSGSLVMICLILKAFDKKFSGKKETQEVTDTCKYPKLSSLSMGLFPLLHFYSFLYYTDPSSTLIVLAAYYACIVKSHRSAAVLGLVSIFFRQSNIIWVIFMAGTVVAEHLQGISAINEISASPDIKDKLVRFGAQLFTALLRYLLVIGNLMELMILIWPYLAVTALFALFVYVNDGIVVGDRSSHQAVAHLPQLFYFSAFTLFFASPVLISFNKVKRFGHTAKKKWLNFLCFFILAVYALIKHSYVHPYLLADNRHYVFYLWRLLFGKVFLRICLIPVYMYAGWSMNDSLRMNSHCTLLWRLVFFVCVCAAVVPQKLLEFRYFILPFLFFRLHVKQQSRAVVCLELLLHACVNAFTAYVFVTKTFTWPDSEELQRIIW